MLQLASCYAPAPIPASLLNARSLTETCLLTDFGDTSPTAEDRAEEALHGLQITGILEPADGGNALHTVIIEAGRASIGGSGLASTRIRHAAIELPSTAARLSCRTSIRSPGRSTCCSARTC